MEVGHLQAQEQSRQSGKQWIPARKGVKGYMADPVIVEDQSITTAGKQKLVIDLARRTFFVGTGMERTIQ